MTQRLTDHARLRQLLAASQRERFAPGFADRATDRWRAELTGREDATTTFEVAATRLFARFVPFAVAAALLLALNNVRHRNEDQSLVRALVGAPEVSAPPASLATIYGLGTLVPPNQE